MVSGCDGLLLWDAFVVKDLVASYGHEGSGPTEKATNEQSMKQPLHKPMKQPQPHRQQPGEKLEAAWLGGLTLAMLALGVT